MEAIKFTWEKGDTYSTIREKLLNLIGKSVVNKQNEKLPFTIFAVSEIIEDELECIGDGFFKFLDGDFAYKDGQGGYNFKGGKNLLTWTYRVTLGMEDKNGNRMSQDYRFDIPRTKNR